MSQVTKRALEASLKNLLLQKPLSKITISDITEDCGINRMTFLLPLQGHLRPCRMVVSGGRQQGARRQQDLRDVAAGFFAAL